MLYSIFDTSSSLLCFYFHQSIKINLYILFIGTSNSIRVSIWRFGLVDDIWSRADLFESIWRFGWFVLSLLGFEGFFEGSFDLIIIFVIIIVEIVWVILFLFSLRIEAVLVRIVLTFFFLWFIIKIMSQSCSCEGIDLPLILSKISSPIDWVGIQLLITMAHHTNLVFGSLRVFF